MLTLLKALEDFYQTATPEQQERLVPIMLRGTIINAMLQARLGPQIKWLNFPKDQGQPLRRDIDRFPRCAN